MGDWDELALQIAREPRTARAAAAHAAVRVMRTVLREDWLKRGWVPPELGLASSHALAFAQLLELALRLDHFSNASGVDVVRRAVRSNRTPEQWRHTQLQLELAALALAVDATIQFESGQKNAWPADVVLTARGQAVSVETFAIFTSYAWRAAALQSEDIAERLLALQARLDLSIVVDFGGVTLENDALEAWLRDVEEAGKNVAVDGARRTVMRDAVRAEIAPRDGGPPSQFRGPPIRFSPWSRIVAKLDDKRRQVRTGPHDVWLRTDFLDGTWQFSRWGHWSLADKLDAMGAHLRAEFRDVEGVDGVVISSGPAFAQSRFSDEDATATGGAVALRRNLRPFRVRETLIVPLRPRANVVTEVFAAAYDAEPTWLEGALHAAGWGDLDAIFELG